MHIEKQHEQFLLNHLSYVIRDHIASSAETYAEVALGQIKREKEGIDDVTIRVEIKFEGILPQIAKYQAGEIDAL